MSMPSQPSVHHSFDINIASEHSIEEAILIHHFAFWVQHNMRSKKNLIEGRTWVYQTQEDIAAHYPYMTKEIIRRNIDKLVEKGILKKGNFNNTKFDRTIWYSFENEEIFTVRQNSQMETAKRPNQTGKSASSIYDKDTKQMQKQQQEPAGGAVAFYSCIQKIGLSESEMKSLMKYPESEVKIAVDFVGSPGFNIKTTLIQSLIWAINEKPKSAEPIDEEKNKRWAETAEEIMESKYGRIECLSSKIYFYNTGSNDSTCHEIMYTDREFNRKLNEKLRELRFTKKKMTR